MRHTLINKGLGYGSMGRMNALNHVKCEMCESGGVDEFARH
jgi:hypothetical protein